MAPQREWFEKDYYRVLGVSDTATQKDITSAYRKLSRQYHPDANPDDAAAEERFKEVSAAYDVVGDAEKRKEYDEVRKLGPMGGMFGAPAARAPAAPVAATSRFEDVGDLGDILGGLFGRGRRRGARAVRAGAPGPTAGRTSRPSCTSTSRTRSQGLTTTIHLTSDAACSTCHGSGARPGTTPTTCPQCQGRGVIDDNQGFFSFSQPCPDCAGQGYLIEDPCPTCRGTGVERRPREVKVRLPAGVADGQRIRLKGRGGPGRNGGPPGDLYVTGRVEPHRAVRAPGRRPHADRAGDVPRGGARRRRRGCPRSTAARSSSASRPAPGRVARCGSRARASTGRKKTGDLLVTVEVAVPAEHDRRRAQGGRGPGGRDRRQSPREHLGGARKDDERCDPTAVT